MGFEMESWIQDCPYRVWWTLPPYQKSGYRKDLIMWCQRYCTWTTSQAMDHWHSIWQSKKIHKSSCKSPTTPLSTIQLSQQKNLILTLLLTTTPFSQSIPHRNTDKNKTGQTTVHICIISPTSMGIPNMTVMDNYSTYISKQSKQTAAYV